MSIANQFDAACVDFYSSLAENDLTLAGQVAWALQTMVNDNVLDGIQCEMVHDCLQKLGRAGVSDLERHSKPVVHLVELANIARVCAVAGAPHDDTAMQSFSATAAKLVGAVGRKCLESLDTSKLSSISLVASAPSSADSSMHLQHARVIFAEAACHINGMSSIGFRPSLVLSGIAPVCAACAEHVISVAQHFQKSARLQEWVKFSQVGGAPPRRARKAGMLVQEIIDPVLNEASEICQEFANFHTFVTDINNNLRSAINLAQGITGNANANANANANDSSANARTNTSASESIRKIREAGQEIVVGYMMVEAYCVTQNLETAVKIAVVDGINSHQRQAQGNSGVENGLTTTMATNKPMMSTPVVASRQSPSISLVEESFFIFKHRFSRALNTLHIDAPRFILNRLQAALEEIVLPEVQKLLSLESTLDVSAVIFCGSGSSSGSGARSMGGMRSSSEPASDVASELTSDFNATLNQLLDGNNGLKTNATSSSNLTSTSTTTLQNTRRHHPLSSLLVAACSARRAEQHSNDFILYVQGQFKAAFGENTLASVEPMLDELRNAANSFQCMHASALEELASAMDDKIKDVIRSTALLDGEKYELESEDFHRREVNDLFAKKVVDHLHHETSLLQRCKHVMAIDDYTALVRVVATHVASIVEKVWKQMRVNENGGLMMQKDLRTLIDQISHKELEAGSVRSCFARLTALVWLVNLENPESLIEENTLASSKHVLACLNREEVGHRLKLRIEFRRDQIDNVVGQFFSQ